jgi:sRNA-binding protein
VKSDKTPKLANAKPSKAKRRRRRQANAGIALFAEKFPAAFSYVDGFAERQPLKVLRTWGSHDLKCQPLKLGIDHDLEKLLAIKRHIIKNALRSYCGSYAYLKSMSPGAVRVDLHGEPAGIVTEEEAAIAKQQLAENYPLAA